MSRNFREACRIVDDAIRQALVSRWIGSDNRRFQAVERQLTEGGPVSPRAVICNGSGMRLTIGSKWRLSSSQR
jgi:hypothetical protein